MLYEIVHIAGE